MSGQGVNIAKSATYNDASRAWEEVRQSSEIQFAPLPPMKPPETPAWLEWLSKVMEAVFGPLRDALAKALGAAWSTIQYAMLALAAVLLLYVLWRLLEPVLQRLRERKAEPETWAPTREEAFALLSDADRLAAEGRYGDAAHLLLLRSIGQIRTFQPGTLAPANTAREIANFPQLPEAARNAFSIIAGRVEESLFALRELDHAGWTVARTAYADFALADLRLGSAR